MRRASGPERQPGSGESTAARTRRVLGAALVRRRLLLLALAVASAQVRTGLPTAARPAAQEPQSLSPVVFVVAFPSYGRPRQDYDTMSRDLIAELERATSYHGYADPDAPPFLRYRLYDDGVVVDELPPRVLRNGNADYADVYERYGLCDLIAAGEVDEVWFIVAGNGNGTTLGHMPEWTTNGPGWSSSRFHATALSVNLPDCGRTVTTMMYHYGLDLGFALHSFAHRSEGFFMTHVPCEFITESWPWQGRDLAWLDDCPDLDRDRYAFVARPCAANDDVAACGDVHAPPNRTSDEAYIYGDTTYAQTTCRDWSLDGSAAVTAVNCTDWGCSQRGYMTWWMQNVPGLGNTNRDAAGRPLANWWPLLFRAPPVQGPPTPTAGPSPVPEVLFEDRFEGERDARWTDWDLPPGAVSRVVDEGALAVSGFGAESVSRVADLSCTDCAVEALVRVAPDAAADDERAVGLVLRAVDPSELILAHVRLAKPIGSDTVPSISMWRRRGWAWSLLAEDRMALEANTWYRLRLEAQGEWLRLYADDYLMLTARDRGQPAAGSAGIRVSQALGRYDDFRVSSVDCLRLTQTATPGAGTAVPPPPTATRTRPPRPPTATPTPTATRPTPRPTVEGGSQAFLPLALRPAAAPRVLQSEFLGQDGAGYVGPGCALEAAPDDIHIRLRAPLGHGRPVAFVVTDSEGRGLWVHPCNQVNWWLMPVANAWFEPRWDLYLEPHRAAPEGTAYYVEVSFADGWTSGAWMAGTAVLP